MPESISELVGLLDLERLDEDLFRGSHPSSSEMTRVFGGQVAAQALMAACSSIPAGRNVHSLHAYFLLGGDPSVPIIYDVDRIRDGGSFSTRRVSARQHGEVIFYMTASFHKQESGYDHQDEMPVVPPVEKSIPMIDLLKTLNEDVAEHWKREWAAIDLRYVGDNRSDDDTTRKTVPAVQRMWFRANGDLPDDPVLNACVLTYISDLSLLGTSLLPHGVLIGSPRIQPASLDHAVWFHRPVRADEWLLYDQTSPSATGARGFATANIYAQGGELVASVAQEGLIRPIEPRR
ncbi:acyl-CoA thioesterase [Solicola gregarius]|uniref:Acyl-CoA thioesterase 2 n=1 Tax=Solicola gregarius TaxID=2908642 RepID=A0AA46TGD9_9ACTN|nr:acyl-CoA thioesterase II [Solicola gregarius]UYM04869.1 acyl-CoA thioesterase II [Solicola gregarius]